MTYTLYFENSRGERRSIGTYDGDSGPAESWAILEMQRFCSERKFSIPYLRCWNTPEDETCYDVGSHTEFFYVQPALMWEEKSTQTE